MHHFYLAILMAALFMVTPAVNAQQNAINKTKDQDATPEFIRCYTVEHEKQRRLLNPNLPTTEDFENWLSPLVQEYKEALRENPQRSNNTYTIPVVVHVLHNGDNANISTAQIQSQIDVLNEDFNRLAGSRGAGTSSIANLNYNGLAAVMNVHFVMAEFDENGNPTNGINRVHIGQRFGINGGATRNELENTIKPGTSWNPTQYMNMWTVKFKAPDDNLLGYAQFPEGSGLSGMSSASSNAATDGVVMRYTAFGTSDQDDGSFVTATPYDLGRTATHEVGHWLGLRHIWGDGIGCNLPVAPPSCSCLFDDYCDDTPNSEKANYSCNGLEISACYNHIGRDMVENYMDYSNDECMNIFTNDQKARVIAVLTNSPRRKELNSSPAISGNFSDNDNNRFLVSNGGTNIGNSTIVSNIFPNPVQESLHLVLENTEENVVVNLRNYLGQRIEISTDFQGDRVQINTSSLPNGFYLVEVSRGAVVESYKIVVKR